MIPDPPRIAVTRRLTVVCTRCPAGWEIDPTDDLECPLCLTSAHVEVRDVVIVVPVGRVSK